MGLFNLGKSEQSSSPIIKWLMSVDKEYDKAFQIKNTAGLTNDLTRNCLIRLTERVRHGEKAYSGISRYQHTTWKPKEKTAQGYVYLKEVRYDQIKMSHGITADVGDDYDELWTVVQENGKNKVSEIRRIT